MKRIAASNNPHQWPRQKVKQVECRPRDLVIRIADWIADWTADKSEPAYDVEVYVGGVYDFNLSQTFCTLNAGKTKKQACAEAVAFAGQRISELL